MTVSCPQWSLKNCCLYQPGNWSHYKTRQCFIPYQTQQPTGRTGEVIAHTNLSTYSSSFIIVNINIPTMILIVIGVNIPIMKLGLGYTGVSRQEVRWWNICLKLLQFLSHLNETCYKHSLWCVDVHDMRPYQRILESCPFLNILTSLSLYGTKQG